MAKIIKYSLLTIISLIALIAIGIALLMTTVNPNDLKGPITQQVKALTGRQLIINGNLNWSFFPGLGINIHDIQLANPPGFANSTFASLTEADLTLRLLPLLSGKFELGHLVLKGLTINLIKKADGSNNWQATTWKSFEKPQQATTQKPAAILKNNNKKSRYTLEPLGLTISSIDISNANLNFQDLQNKNSYAIHNLTLQSSGVNLSKTNFSKAFPITLKFDFNSTKPDLYGRMSVATTLHFNQSEQIITLAPFEFSAKLNGKLNGETLPEKGITVNLKMETQLNLHKQTLDLTKMIGEIANMRFHIKAKGKNIFDAPAFYGSIEILQFSPKLFINNFSEKPFSTQDPNVLQSASLQTQFVANNGKITLSELKLHIDKSTLTGNIALQNSEQGTSHFNLILDQINIGNYLPKSDNNTKNNSTANAIKTAQAITNSKAISNTMSNKIIPIKLLRQLNLTGSIQVGNLLANHLQLSNLKVKVVANKGIININPLSAVLYQGQFNGSASVNVQSDIPKLKLTENIHNIQIESLLKALQYKKNLQITGTANINSTLNASGSTTKAITKTLNGDMKFGLTNGVIKGINLGHQIDVATSLVSKQPLPDQKGADETPFGDLTATVQIKNGIAISNDLLLQSPAMTITGNGVINLVQQTINYAVKATAIQGKVPPRITKLQNQLGGSIPIKITGTFDDYKVYPDMPQILQNSATAYLKKHAKTLKTKVSEQLKKLGGQLQQQLQGLFN